ncbi:DUF72 domain-containing protein [Roseomonas sp. BN140053]|uniref:DUF72 domain-containing protein n=1 Tax=Roseomonas sp. BN140053 TaxID=3391898 RepID=UPI0039E81FE9
MEFRIGTAGWSIPRQHGDSFPAEGSHLERYAGRFPAVEINSSFYRPHRPATYARWAASVPPGFRFAAKLPREIMHDRRLREAEEPLRRFLGEVTSLGSSLGPLLVQLPPSLRYEAALAEGFFTTLRAQFGGEVVCEPRHATWFTDGVDAQLAGFRVARVAADPAVVPRAAEPGGWPGLAYWRLHGSPEIYHSPYGSEAVAAVGQRLRATPAETRTAWCIFDNTALGEATRDALDLLDRL